MTLSTRLGRLRPIPKPNGTILLATAVLPDAVRVPRLVRQIDMVAGPGIRPGNLVQYVVDIWDIQICAGDGTDSVYNFACFP